MNWIKQHKATATVIGVGGVAVVIFLLVWFQPQALFIDNVVDDTIPGAQPAPTTTTTTEPAQPSTTGGSTETTTPPTTTSTVTPTTTSTQFPLTLASGEFIGLAHSGTGTALVLELEDGTRILRFEDLMVDNGPDLRVILSTSELVDDDSAYDDGDFVDLGDLKGNQGNQNYEIPPDVDLDGYATVAIWCRRFNVTFNAAPLDQ
jgi:Electron transfer DM13